VSLESLKMTGASKISVHDVPASDGLLEKYQQLLLAFKRTFDKLHHVSQETSGACTFFSHVTDKIVSDTPRFL
jgi:hypothetical protein